MAIGRKSLALSAWGTANMRTGGDDIAQALALMGVRPSWDANSGRLAGFEILPLSILDRPRVDVTLAHLRILPRCLSRSRSIWSPAPRAPSPNWTSRRP